MNSMKFKAKGSRMLRAAASAVLAAASLGATAQTVDLTGLDYFTYGNVNSYLADPLNIDSSPGKIKDLIVVYTGASGGGVTTNTAGFDNAYGAPNGTIPFASTQPIGATPPDPYSGFIADPKSTTWDANVAALTAFLGGNDLLFFFNNNETNSDPTLAIWARIWITQGTGDAATLYGRSLYLSNVICGATAGSCVDAAFGAGGVLNGDATIYNPNNITDPVTTAATTQYVESGRPVVGSDGKTINSNLGANEVAYVALVPLLNQYLDEIAASGSDLNNYTLHLDLRLGCDATMTRLQGCTGRAIDNGYEQLFIGTAQAVTLVPEPGSMALAGLALMGIFGAKRRARRG